MVVVQGCYYFWFCIHSRNLFVFLDIKNDKYTIIHKLFLQIICQFLIRWTSKNITISMKVNECKLSCVHRNELEHIIESLKRELRQYCYNRWTVAVRYRIYVVETYHADHALFTCMDIIKRRILKHAWNIILKYSKSWNLKQ